MRQLRKKYVTEWSKCLTFNINLNARYNYDRKENTLNKLIINNRRT